MYSQAKKIVNQDLPLEKLPFLAEVRNISWTKRHEPLKTLHLEPIDKDSLPINILTTRSSCVTTGDVVFSSHPFSEQAKNRNNLFIKCHNGFVQIYPFFSIQTTICIGDLNIPVTIKEITQSDEFEGYVALSKYHYRDKSLFGRHAPLVAKMSHPMLTNVVGYIDLTNAFFVNAPRKNILNQPTKINGISWDDWTKDVIRQRIPLFVRIARCVVHPELRSTGIGKILVESASAFAKNHWQSANWKPYFMEISADMLRYIPFAEKAGMKYVGETTGNLDRIVKDLRYLNANENRIQKEIFKDGMTGIIDAKYSQLQKAIIAKNGSKVKCPSDYVAQQIANPTLDGWAKLSGVLSFPKPHYMMGLTKESMELINSRVKELDLTKPDIDIQNILSQIKNKRLIEEVVVDNISFEVNSSITRTKTTHEIERAFEISLDNLTHTIISDLGLKIQPGEILVVTGLSGTGKTTFLQLLAGNIQPTRGSIQVPSNAKIGLLKPINSSKPLIEVLGKKDAGKGIFWMGIVGLSEPSLYIKSFHSLSAGQKYRAMLAELLAKKANFWLIDEFCENLDIINTNLLSQKISAIARKVGATVVIASSDATRFSKSLDPNRVLIIKGITATSGYEIKTGNEFNSQI